MVVFGGLWDIAIVVFVVLVLAKYANVTSKKGLGWLATAGVLALLAAGSGDLLAVAGTAVTYWVAALFSVLSWIALLVGVLMAALELMKMK